MLLLDFSSPISFPESTNSYFSKVIEFCQEWKSGKKEFRLTTSGSTGIPKEVIITRNAMISSVKLTQKLLNLEKGDTALLGLSIDYVAGKMMLVRAMEIGLQLMIVPPQSNPLENLTTFFDFSAFVPLQIETIIKNTPEKLELFQKAKGVLIGGAPLRPNTEKIVSDLQIPFIVTYGMTETVSHVAYRYISTKKKNDFFTILEGIDTQMDERGCLKLRGAVTNGIWVQTNDCVKWKTEKEFVLLGRIDDVIVSGGVKIALYYVENMISEVLSEVNQSYSFTVQAVPHETLGQKLVLVSERKGQPFFESEDFSKKLRKKLPNLYFLPKEYIFIDYFPFTESGKIDRKRIKQGLIST